MFCYIWTVTFIYIEKTISITRPKEVQTQLSELLQSWKRMLFIGPLLHD